MALEYGTVNMGAEKPRTPEPGDRATRYVTYQDLSPVQSAATGSLAYGSYGFIPSLFNTLGNIESSRNYSIPCWKSPCGAVVSVTPGSDTLGLKITGIAHQSDWKLFGGGSDVMWYVPYF